MSYQDVKDRLYRGHKKIANNTYLELRELHIATVEEGWTDEKFIEMRLHGNQIARFHYDYLQLYSAGWCTSTTKSRLNLALDIANCPQGIGQHNYTWYLYGKQEFYDGIKIDYTGKIIN